MSNILADGDNRLVGRIHEGNCPPFVGAGDEVDLRGLRLRALFTRGPTDEHLAYVLLDGARSGAYRGAD